MLTFGVEQSFQVLKTFFILNPERMGGKKDFSAYFVKWGNLFLFQRLYFIYLGLWCVSAKWLNFTRIPFALKHTDVKQQFMQHFIIQT